MKLHYVAVGENRDVGSFCRPRHRGLKTTVDIQEVTCVACLRQLIRLCVRVVESTRRDVDAITPLVRALDARLPKRINLEE